MGEEEAIPTPTPALEPVKAWRTYISEELPRSVKESADSAIRSARSLQQSSSTHLRSLQVRFRHSLFRPSSSNRISNASCRNFSPSLELNTDIMRRLSLTELKVPSPSPHLTSSIPCRLVVPIEIGLVLFLASCC
ncbi:UNVERIFIED_CONTAM: hypothetical protein Sangu_0314900 [Sesamum angustifolium]|uniref:Uncharacterized protein n=1 Tax=Sesamum angustifolium TaxID=2727405 RepID=A0AAW2QR88_9LAMI